MIRFQCDYAEGAHPSILKKLEETNFDQTAGYGIPTVTVPEKG